MGEAKRKALARQKTTVVLDTFGGRIHVECDPAAAAEIVNVVVASTGEFKQSF